MANYKYIGPSQLQTTLNDLKIALNALWQKKEEGKGLSTNDLTNDLLQKLNDLKSVSASAELTTGTKIGEITIGTDTITIYAPTIPTVDSAMSATSENAVQNKVIKQYVDDAVGAVTSIKFEKVTTLPATGQNGVIYLVPKISAQTSNVYEEYIWIAVDSKFEKIGDTAIDLSGYVQKTDIAAMTDEEIVNVFKVVFPDVTFD